LSMLKLDQWDRLRGRSRHRQPAAAARHAPRQPPVAAGRAALACCSTS
jgi:hypothetical protein